MHAIPIKRATRSYAWVKLLTLCSLIASLAVSSQIGNPLVAGAAVKQSFHQLPWTGQNGVSQSSQCASISPGYACTIGGYAAWLKHPTGWAWSDYGGSFPSHNAFGPHNCTLYVAYLLQEDNITLSWSANASGWATEAAANGAVVNQIPSVGSVAQWNSNHIAFVDAVTAHYIVITSDNFQPQNVSTMPGGFTDSFIIPRQSSSMPDNFIHFAAPLVLPLDLRREG
jgi:surface antigen